MTNEHCTRIPKWKITGLLNYPLDDLIKGMNEMGVCVFPMARKGQCAKVQMSGFLSVCDVKFLFKRFIQTLKHVPEPE